MSATMINENAYMQDLKEEDELSTSFGGSDSEVSPTSEDEPSLPETSGALLAAVVDLSTDAKLVGQVHLMLSTFFEMCVFLTTVLFGVAMRTQLADKAPAHTSHLPACPHLQTKKTAKTQRQQVRPPPGLSLPHHEAKGRSFANQVVRPPPGLSLERFEQEDHGLSIEEVGPPPGLSLRPMRPAMPPPGLEAFCPPPGVFFDHTSTKPQALPTRRTRGRKKNNAAVTESAQLSLPPVQPKPVVTEQPKAPPAPLVPREFEQAAYRKELSDVLRELASYNNVAASVKRIRAQNVPRERQAAEFRDILTRAAEENRGVARRLSFAFAAGLAAGATDSAFSREECLNGIQLFFEDVFEDLASEVPRLRNKLANELVPTLRTVFSEDEVSRLVPPDCRTVVC